MSKLFLCRDLHTNYELYFELTLIFKQRDLYWNDNNTILTRISHPQQVKQVQKSGPYILSGYSFGACVAFEMALLLETAKEKVTLLLLDGSPTYVASYTGNYKAHKGKTDNKNADADALTYFISLFKDDVDYLKVRAGRM